MLIYNLFPLLAGKLTHWGSHLERAKDLGFDWVFVNPIQKTGKSGSLYSVADYAEINPRIVDAAAGTTGREQVLAMTTQAKELGLRVMVDLVINHTAYDSPLVTQHARWYKQENGRVAHPFALEDGHKVVWEDLAHLDWRCSEREAMFQYFRGVVFDLVELGFEGFRCDAAYQVPADIWRRLIQETKAKYPAVAFTAETLGCPADLTRETAAAGFDYVFNSSKWWDFEAPWLLEQYNLVRNVCPTIGFPESHDTARLAEEMHGNVKALEQRYLFSALFSGGVLMPMGYEFAFKRRLHVVMTEPEHWEHTGVDLSDFIRKTNAVKRAFPVFQEDAPTHLLHNHDNRNVMVMWKGATKVRQEALIILNRDPWNRSYYRSDRLRNLVQSGMPLKCVSPENPMEHIAEPFEYELRPGEAIVIVAAR